MNYAKMLKEAKPAAPVSPGLINFIFREADKHLSTEKTEQQQFERYNDPPRNLQIVNDIEFHDFFTYCTKPIKTKQIICFDLYHCNASLFPVKNTGDSLFSGEIGFAIIDDWYNPIEARNRKERRVLLARYGSPEQWDEFRGRFAAQFAGDNS